MLTLRRSDRRARDFPHRLAEMPPNNVTSFSDIEVQKMKKAVESLMAANEEKVPSEPKYHCSCVRLFVCVLVRVCAVALL